MPRHFTMPRWHFNKAKWIAGKMGLNIGYRHFSSGQFHFVLICHLLSPRYHHVTTTLVVGNAPSRMRLPLAFLAAPARDRLSMDDADAHGHRSPILPGLLYRARLYREIDAAGHHAQLSPGRRRLPARRR